MHFNFDHHNVLFYAGIGHINCTCGLNLPSIYEEDPNHTFLTKYLNYTTCALAEELSNAIHYFKNTFNIDFTPHLGSTNKILHITGARLYPFILSPSLNTELVSPNKALVHDGGWILEILEPGYTGIHNNLSTNFQVGTFFVWGFQKLTHLDNSCQIFHYHSTEPGQIFNSFINGTYIIFNLRKKCPGNYISSISLSKRNQDCNYTFCFQLQYIGFLFLNRIIKVFSGIIISI